MLTDIRAEVEAAATEYRALVDQLEAKRQELLELRSDRGLDGDLPKPATLANEPNVAASGRSEEEPCRAACPARRSNPPSSRPACWPCCVPTSPSARVRLHRRPGSRSKQGVSVGRLRRSDARWMDGKVDLIGPAFASTWGGSDEEKAEAERVRMHRQEANRPMWGE